MPNNVTFENIWLIGTGQMAIEYAKVLISLNKKFTVIGRSEESAREFKQKTGIKALAGGLENLINTTTCIPQYVIIAVNVEQLAVTSTILIRYGVERILIEKPAGLNYQEVEFLCEVATKENVTAYVAYNRHFYASVIRGKEIIEEDGGVVSFNFEFTEWSHVIEKLRKPTEVLENWFLANSTHVIDLAFYIGGYPKQISCYTSGTTDWYKRASVFCGAGTTEKGALFSYHANWKGPGRWSLEVITPKHRLIFKPFEKLQIQNIGSITIDNVAIDDEFEREFKPGLYMQTKEFIGNSSDKFVTIQQHLVNIQVYKKIENFPK